MWVWYRGEMESQARQYPLHCTTKLLSVLQCAGTVEGQAQVSLDTKIFQRLFS